MRTGPQKPSKHGLPAPDEVCEEGRGGTSATALQVCAHEISEEDEFIILASDGLWNCLGNAQAVRLARLELDAYEDATMACERLIEAALQTNKADDNITAMIAVLNPPTHGRSSRPRRPRLSLTKRAGTTT